MGQNYWKTRSTAYEEAQKEALRAAHRYLTLDDLCRHVASPSRLAWCAEVLSEAGARRVELDGKPAIAVPADRCGGKLRYAVWVMGMETGGTEIALVLDQPPAKPSALALPEAKRQMGLFA